MNIGYARVTLGGAHLFSQIAQLQAAGCERIFQDQAATADAARPELAAAVAFAQAGDQLVVTGFDRAAGSIGQLLRLIRRLAAKKAGFRALNSPFDTAAPSGEQMVSLLASLAQFERQLWRERQREGIERARAAGKYTGRKPTARAKAGQVLTLAKQGVKKGEIARRLEISQASVYRILAEHR